jgi:hypothetical protein
MQLNQKHNNTMNNKILKLAAIIMAPAALLALAACSSTPDSGSVRAGIVLDSVTSTATVQSIDAADRTVVLLHPDGSLTTYECGPDVRNFDQIKVGDHVSATVAESLAIALIKGGGGPTGVGSSSALVRSPLGDKPGAQMVDTVGFIAKVVNVDTANRMVTLQMADGKSQTVKVGPDINLANVSAGDDVGVRVTRAIAIAVTAAP